MLICKTQWTRAKLDVHRFWYWWCMDLYEIEYLIDNNKKEPEDNNIPSLKKKVALFVLQVCVTSNEL